MRGLWHLLGLDNASGMPYLMWSGFGGDLPILGGLLVFLRHRNCHIHGCWRLGRHKVDGTGHVVCRAHHPEGAPLRLTACSECDWNRHEACKRAGCRCGCAWSL